LLATATAAPAATTPAISHFASRPPPTNRLTMPESILTVS
jgi:hypothetical protein